MKVSVIYATESGNSEMLAEDLVSGIGDEYGAEVLSIDEVDPANLEPETFYAFVTSTYGEGDLPETGQTFVEALASKQPDLSAVRFGVFGLGDTSYETFNHGSTTLMEALLARKASMIGERGTHDAASGEMPEDIALPWLKNLLALQA